MSTSSWDSADAKRLYLRLVQVADDGQRQQRLAQEGAGNEELVRQVNALLEADQRLGIGILDRVGKLLGTPEQLADLETRGAPQSTELPPATIGPYKLMELLGEGGMGIVYVAQQQTPIRRKVALKLIKPGMASRQVIARFEAERQALAIMSHPHIAKVLDAGTTESGTPFFVMELVRGVPITTFCRAHANAVNEKLELFCQVCDAVHHAHQKGVIHRDLKPSNVLVELEDTKAVPKVIDFGVAKATQQPLTSDTLYTGINQFIGTPLYMSPEQAELNSLDIDIRSDIYSLGIILYELLTGQTPIDRDVLRQASFDEMRRLIREVNPPLPSSRVSTIGLAVDPTIPAQASTRRLPRKIRIRSELDWIVMKAIEKERTCRYQSAAELADDLRRFLRGEPVQAGPKSWHYRTRKFVQRYRLPLGVIAVIVCVVIAGVTASLRFARESDEARKLAESRLVSEELARRDLLREAQAKQAALLLSRDSLDRALQVVNDLYTEIALDWIADDVVPSDIQRRFLLKAHDFYGHVLEQPDTYHLSVQQQALILLRTGQIAEEIRDLDQADNHYRQGLALLDAQPSPLESSLLDNRSMLHASLARVLASRHRLTEAIDQMSLAIKDLRSMVELDPESNPVKVELRNSLLRQSLWARDLGDFRSMQQNWEAARAVNLSTDFTSYESLQSELYLKLVESELRASEGNLAQAKSLADEAWKDCRLAIVRLGDSRIFRDGELDCLENLLRYELLAEDFDSANRTSETLVSHLETRMTGEIAPDRYILRNLFDPVRFPQADQPLLAARWVDAQVNRAIGLQRQNRMIEAELLLGRAMVVNDFLTVAYESDPRHLVAQANIHTQLALLLSDSHPAESDDAATSAARAWLDAIESFPTAKSYRSRLAFPSRLAEQSDFESFIKYFPDFDVPDDGALKLLVASQAVDSSINSVKRRAQAWLWTDAGQWEQALQWCQQLRDHRGEQEPFACLLTAECLIGQGKTAEARQLLEQIPPPTYEQEPFLLSLRTRVSNKLSEGTSETPYEQ